MDSIEARASALNHASHELGQKAPHTEVLARAEAYAAFLLGKAPDAEVPLEARAEAAYAAYREVLPGEGELWGELSPARRALARQQVRAALGIPPSAADHKLAMTLA